jgi:hypothetical protein
LRKALFGSVVLRLQGLSLALLLLVDLKQQDAGTQLGEMMQFVLSAPCFSAQLTS